MVLGVTSTTNIGCLDIAATTVDSTATKAAGGWFQNLFQVFTQFSIEIFRRFPDLSFPNDIPYPC